MPLVLGSRPGGDPFELSRVEPENQPRFLSSYLQHKFRTQAPDLNGLVSLSHSVSEFLAPSRD